MGCLLALVCSTACDDESGPAAHDSVLSDATTDVRQDDVMGPDVLPPADLPMSDATSDAPLIADASAQDQAVDHTADQTTDLLVDGSADASVAPSSTCSQAPLVQLSGGKAVLNGDTTTFADEFANLGCSASSSLALDGPQGYYRIAAQQNAWYKIVLTPTFDAYFYVFTSSACTESAIQADCTSGGATGMNSRSVSAGSAQAIYFKAPTASGFYVGVDSIASWFNGPFELTVETFTPPGNATCAAAQPLTFRGKVATVTSDTGVTITPDEFSGLTCGTTSMEGPQVYYTFTAQTGATYTIEVTADSAQFLHPFVARSSCVAADIAADCSSAGVEGDVVSASLGSGQTGKITFTPSHAGPFLIGIDSSASFNYGGFTLVVTESP
jgi:hypothetical protein